MPKNRSHQHFSLDMSSVKYVLHKNNCKEGERGETMKTISVPELVLTTSRPDWRPAGSPDVTRSFSTYLS